MNIETKQALINVQFEMRGSEDLVAAALREISAIEDAERFSKNDAGFLRNRIEGAIERAQKALTLIPEGEE